MQKLMLVSVILITALAGIQSCTGQCYALPSPDANEEYLFAQSVCGGVDNGPLNPTVFTTDETRTMTKIGTYYYNIGNGATPGTIGLKDQNGKIWGPWQAKGQGSVPTIGWYI